MEYQYIKRAAEYASQVLTGKIPACEYVKQACRRFQADFSRTDIIMHYDAEKWCAFQECLPHVKGKWAAKGTTLELSDWQVFCTVNIYGWKWVQKALTKVQTTQVTLAGIGKVRVAVKGSHPGKRRFREAYIEVPRKNGKSFWVAGIGLGHLAIDDEFGAEVYCGATSEKQAWEVFSPAKQIVDRTEDLREAFQIGAAAKRLYKLSDASKFEPVIGKPGDGASPSCGIADEFHEHTDSDLVDTFTTGMGAREQPVMIYITTAGADMGGPCYAKRDDMIKILSGSVEDDTVFAVIYTLDEDDQWDTVEAQRKANPNYGVSVDSDFLAAQLSQARRSPTRQVAYKTKHLNLWVGAKKAWMNMLAYQACRTRGISLEQMKGRRCYAAVDLASVSDFACVGFLFPPENPAEKWRGFVRHYLPEDTVLDGGNTRYKAWHGAGLIVATPGNVTDYDEIEEDLRQDAGRFDIIRVGFDPFQATQFSSHLIDDGMPLVQYGATVKNFSEPMKLLEGMILKGDIEFDMDDAVLTWMFGNVVAKVDKKDNVFPDKDRPGNKIDGIITLIMALRAYLDDDSLPQYDGELMVV